MWKPHPTDEFSKRFKKHAKKHEAAALATMQNLGRFISLLNERPIHQIKAGFIHPEPFGVKAIDQTGASRKLRETRLYAYPDEKTKLVYLITIGDKNSQQKDINERCKVFVDKLKKAGENG